MKTDAERARDDERRRLEKLRRESKAYDDAVQRAARQDKSPKGRKQARIRKDVDESLAAKQARAKNPRYTGQPKQRIAESEQKNRNGGAIMKARGGTFKGTF